MEAITRAAAVLTLLSGTLMGCDPASEPCTGPTCYGGLVGESFEAGTWPWAPWIAPPGSSGGGQVDAACAHDGAFGLADPGWYYRTDGVFGAPGGALEEWVKPTGSGRSYLGFGATSTGTWSFTAAPNTGEIILQRVEYGAATATYSDLASAVVTFTTGNWYRMRVTFGSAGEVTGSLYGADGTTLLQSVTATLAGYAPGGVAIRSFSFCGDAVAAVP